MNVPKPRPPNPHSLRCSLSSARRHRAAAKPTPETTANMMMTIVNATALPLMSARLPPAGVRGLRAGRLAVPPRHLAEQVGDGRQNRDDRHPQELVPVEEGESPERRGQRRSQYDCDRYPNADMRACGAGLRHHVLFRASKMGQGRPPGHIAGGRDAT